MKTAITRADLERWKHPPHKDTALGPMYRDRLQLIALVEELTPALVAIFDGFDRVSQKYHVVQPGIALMIKHGQTIEHARALLPEVGKEG